MKSMKVLIWMGIALFAFMPCLMFLSTGWESEASADSSAVTTVGKNEALPVVGSYENLKKLLQKEISSRQEKMRMDTADGFAMTGAAKSTAAPTQAPVRSGDYSSTNVQVTGVDEADVVKTDGSYIYQTTRQQVIITKAYPANDMKVVSKLTYKENEFTPLELYVDDKYLVVIGRKGYSKAAAREYPEYRLPTSVEARIYDNRDKTNVKLVRELELEGRYLSSRKIGSSLYLIANKNIDTYQLLNTTKELPAPVYRDSASQSGYVSMNYQQIRYFPGAIKPNYLMVAGINLASKDAKMSASSYLGDGENIYASTENLYVALQDQQEEPIAVKGKKAMIDRILPPMDDAAPAIHTLVYKFALNNGAITYQGKGAVPGTTLNQFSMDEHNGNLRIATTSGDIWREDEHTSKNNLYVLDKSLHVIGKIENIAPGEKIYSTRFIGDRAYMVTFKTVDPLFVIDLKKPASPKILGALKIPGYSDYLHPYDQNHIIGFGKETFEMKGNAYYQGLKVAMFDVSDVSRPVEMFTQIIGDRGTDSEILHNHKALLFSKEKNLLAFPVTLMETDKNAKQQEDLAYGKFTFQGAFVYHLDLKQGFKLRGKISHLSAEERLKAGDGWYKSEKNVNRILYINDTIYTLSEQMLKANRLIDLKAMKNVSFSQ